MLSHRGVSRRGLQGVINEHLRDVPRLERLRAVYGGGADILRRERAQGLPNNRVAHAYARYIVTVASAYLCGRAVRYQSDTRPKALANVLAHYARCRADSVDIELANQAAVYGRAVELCYCDERARPCVSALDAKSAFVVYDDTVRAKPLMGVHTRELRDADGLPYGVEVHVYTDALHYTYVADSLQGVSDARPCACERHYFGHVPMIEFWNNEQERGDFEDVLPLIAAYDALQSDRVNNQEQLTNALLVITGARLETDEQGRSPAQALRQDKILYLPDREACAQYLSCNESGADSERLREALARDIHKFSMVPDLAQETLGDNASGVALQYRLLSLEHMTRAKERWFAEGLRARLALFCAFLSFKGEDVPGDTDVRLIFTRSLPVDAPAAAQMVKTLEGIVPQDVLLSQLPFMENKPT